MSAETGDEGVERRHHQGLRAELGASTSPSTTTSWPSSTRRPAATIDIEEFVALDDIDPVFFDSAYYLAPDKATTKPYALLTRAMEESGKVGIARVVMRTKQYLCAVRPQSGKLVMSTMVYADEVNSPSDIPELSEVDQVEVSDKELTMARQLIESLAEEFEPAKYSDTHRERVMELIERKASGDEGVVEPPAPQDDKVVDLMAALEASVAAAKEARGRHPTAGDAGAVSSDEMAGSADGARQRRAGDRRRDGTGRRRPSRRERGRDGRRAREAVGCGSATSTRSCSRRTDSPRPRSSTTTCGSRRSCSPHVAGRGVTLAAVSPTASRASSFFEKRCASHRPDYVGVRRRAGRPLRAPSGTATSTRCRRSPGRPTWPAIEIHAPMAMGDDIDSPQLCVFDLDPGRGRHHRRLLSCRATDPWGRWPIVGLELSGQDIRLQGVAGLRAAQHAAHAMSSAPAFAQMVAPGAREAPPRPRSPRT